MAILNSLKNIFNKNQQVSGGNSFEVSQKLKFQDEFNKATIPYVNNSIEQTLNEVFKGQNYNTFQLLNFQANYFCNRKIYVAENNNNLTLIIKHIIRQAFFNGTSAFYKDDLGIYRILYIHKVSHKLNGEVKEIEASYSSIDYDYSNMNNSEFFKDQKRIILKEKDLENLSIFYWNDWKMGAYYWMLPFIKQQESLLKIISATRYSYLKKFNYEVKNSQFVKDEINLFFNENNPFLANISDETELMKNKFNEFSFGNNDIENLKQYYTLFMEVHYKLFGRRMNDDNKNERNISGEIEATQANYDTLEKETFFYLMIFIEKIKKITGENIYELKSDSEKRKDLSILLNEGVGNDV